MKLIVAILRDEDSEQVTQAVISAGFRITRIASTGGFWRRGSTTVMIGIEDDQVEEAIQVIRATCAPPSEPNSKRATLFVLNVMNFVQV